jgi:hypothetical protein
VQLVGYAAVGTGVIFFGMGVLSQTIKRDLAFMGKFLFVGMIALLIAMVANMFLQIPALALTISTLVIVVFSLFLLYDLQRIIRGGETNYVMATTGVYMFNIFANLLNILLALAAKRLKPVSIPAQERLQAPFYWLRLSSSRLFLLGFLLLRLLSRPSSFRLLRRRLLGVGVPLTLSATSACPRRRHAAALHGDAECRSSRRHGAGCGCRTRR